ncbi:MAG TPA: thiol-disulfide oxidoreductase DCC family protein [Bryobacteraceae bacterium]|jgi:predicted DCC family thiol-disulfide oxidoreductase YuxK|nr:thiol-disulfide oxidoreductase DCC family protein [Bryobacteraceae bacterium]
MAGRIDYDGGVSNRLVPSMSPPSPAGQPQTDHPVVLFDGVCNLCNRSVQFIIAHDPSARFRFAPLDSAAARSLIDEAAPRGPLPDSIVLMERRRTYTRSAAALRIARRLRFPWPLLYAFIVVPRPLRDIVYDFIARHRYRWFGKRDTCMVPTPELRARFLT